MIVASLVLEAFTVVWNIVTICVLAKRVRMMTRVWMNFGLTTLRVLWYVFVIICYHSSANDCHYGAPLYFGAHILLYINGVITFVGWFLETLLALVFAYCRRCAPDHFKRASKLIERQYREEDLDRARNRLDKAIRESTDNNV